MKFWIVAAALAVFAESASAFVPTNTNANPQKTPLAVLPKSSDWKGYYTDYDDRQIIKTGADVDFDPLGLADTNAALFWMREAEIKHCRLAMLAAASWPVAEALDKPLARLIGEQPVVDATERNPSLLNGGLDRISPWYWGAILVAAAAVDLTQINKANADPEYTPGDLGFDPLGVFPKDKEGQKVMMAKELRNGRLAMIAITAFAAQEYVYKTGVLEQTPFGDAGIL